MCATRYVDVSLPVYNCACVRVITPVCVCAHRENLCRLHIRDSPIENIALKFMQKNLSIANRRICIFRSVSQSNVSENILLNSMRNIGKILQDSFL